MKTHDLVSNTPKWDAHRKNHFNASEAPAMMGCSAYQSRTALLNAKKFGSSDDVDSATQRRFDDGHRFEALARPLAEEIIGEELYPCTGTEGIYSASFDGLTMDESTAFEHKTLNDELRACESAEELPLMYRVQMEQQLLVSGGKRVLFMASKWDKDDQLLEEKHFWYYPDFALREKIEAGWRQFNQDLIEYQTVEAAPIAVAAPINDLPALAIEITGNVVASNLAQWRSIVTERISSINTDLQSDQDFADADKMVKFLGDGEARIDVVKAQAQSQATSIDEVFRALDEIKATMRAKRLELDKLVKARKENIRVEIAKEAQQAYLAHCNALNERLGGNSYLPGAIVAQFAEVMKSKKTVASLRDAVSTELARVKIDSDAFADKVEKNLRKYGEIAVGYEFLFRDLFALATQPAEAFEAMVQQRISQHVEAKRKEEEATRERIAAEEKTKAEREAAAKVRAELDAIAKQQAETQRAAEAERIEREAREKREAWEKSADDAASAKVIAPIIREEIKARNKQADINQLLAEITTALQPLMFDELEQVAHFIERIKERKAA